MIEKWGIPVQPITGKKPRTVYVYVPDQAREDPEARFPALYMFDGHNVFSTRTPPTAKAGGWGNTWTKTRCR